MTNASSIDSFLLKILQEACDRNASDAHIAPGERVYFRTQGELTPNNELCVTANQTKQAVESLLDASLLQQLQTRGSVDGALSLTDESRFRFNVYLRGGETCMAFRRLDNNIPPLDQLGLNNELYRLCNLTDGMVLVAGPTGSGKSTTIASLIDQINRTRQCHIITIEDPVEFIHPSGKSLVNQRQVGQDVETFNQALMDAVRQDPDVILVGELRDLDTIRTAITAAETGHLVFASVHAGDCKTAIERLVGAFPAEEQNLAARLTATVLRTVIVQHLLPRLPNKNQSDQENVSRRVLASEVMNVNSAISNLIATSNLNQIASIIETSGDDGMWTLDGSLAKLWRSRQISEQTARALARNPEMLSNLAKRVNK